MAEVVLAAEVGRPLGSRAVRRLRREGKIPGVIYGHGTDPVADRRRSARELRVALNGEAGANQLLSLDTGSGTYLTLAREMQRHPVAQTVTHVDFSDRPARRGHRGRRADRAGRRGARGAPRRRPGRPADVHPGHPGAAGRHPDRLEVDISALTIGGAGAGLRPGAARPGSPPTSTPRPRSPSASRRGSSRSRRTEARARARRAQRRRPPRAEPGRRAEARRDEG